MPVHDPQFSKRVRRLLGLSAKAEGVAHEPPAPPPAEADSVLARRALFNRMEIFHERNQLPVTGLTLEVAHRLAVGSDPELASAVALRVRLHRPVSLDWLGEVAGMPNTAEELTALMTMMEQLERSIASFSDTTEAARSATSDYGSALAAHFDGLGQVGKAGKVISELAALTRAMLTRTREAERELTRSARETQLLKSSLDEARRTADRDHLTGLPNRKAFETAFARAFDAALSTGEPLSVAFCDIDEFKRINDLHGHEAGDRVLKVVADTLAAISDDRCHVARHGGEEFVAVFRGVSLEDAIARLDGAREDLAGRRLVNRATELPFGPITFSAGVADVFAYEHRGAALRAADVALYRAKQNGRNRIERAARESAA